METLQMTNYIIVLLGLVHAANEQLQKQFIFSF